MQRDTEAGLRGIAGAGLGALLGGTIASRFPNTIPYAVKTGSNLLQRASAGSAGAFIGGQLGADAANFNNGGALAGGTVGAGLGGLLGSFGAVPFVRANPKHALLKFLLGTGLGTTAGAGLGAYYGDRIPQALRDAF